MYARSIGRVSSVDFLIFAKTLYGFCRLTMIGCGAGDQLPKGGLNAIGALRANGVPGAFRLSRATAFVREEEAMEDHVYRIIEISGSSQTSIEDAIQTAVSRAGRTLRNLRWFEVLQTRGHLEGGKIQHYQVVLKIGFTIDDSNAGV